eukprot:CAMPEP_0119107464 /NCGR_PEP_ID=MMETSP1180-20130426/10293_1 /TAXON_ID=3052 ORGANISM="Chlamydomonas cf sp, Strain CCMP681" /NCGR_SAMPLE_ID=MMETSP1180 /ASSEMBLY_ACC=CAM_ASM_000741 /LENGTH=123 /DNA_ID=CAMNT_0007092951 /DNA_START=143 /DNA_END=514 /DNA_ORIENTATION=+
MMSRVLAADLAGPQFSKAHEYSCIAMGAATPLAIIASKDGFLQRVADFGMLFAIPVHMHVGMCSCITDYLPKVAKGPARMGMLGMSAVTFIGLLKINTTGQGITQTVKSLWHRPAKPVPAPAK